MTINLSHKAIISLTIDPFFEEIPKNTENLAVFVADMFEAMQYHRKNYFIQLASLLKEPQNFYGLHIMGNLTKGEVREYIIDDIHARLEQAARNAGTTLAKLGWKKEIILEKILKKEDHQTNLICQEKYLPEGFNLESFHENFQTKTKQYLARQLNEQIHFHEDENMVLGSSDLTLEDLNKISESLAIIDPQYIHKSINTVKEDPIGNIFDNDVLNQIAEYLPNQYTILKKYFYQLHNVLDYDMEEAFNFFYGNKISCIAIAISLAISKKEKIVELKKCILNVISQVQIQDGVKEAFINYVVMDIKQFIDQKEVSTKTERENNLLFFSANKNKVMSALKCIEKGYSFTEKGVGKIIFENLTLGELQSLSEEIDKSEIKNMPDMKILIRNRIDKIIHNSDVCSVKEKQRLC